MCCQLSVATQGLLAIIVLQSISSRTHNNSVINDEIIVEIRAKRMKKSHVHMPFRCSLNTQIRINSRRYLQSDNKKLLGPLLRSAGHVFPSIESCMAKPPMTDDNDLTLKLYFFIAYRSVGLLQTRVRYKTRQYCDALQLKAP